MPYTIREIELYDIKKGFLNVLTNLSEVGDLNLHDALKILEIIKRNPFHKIFVAVDDGCEVIGTITLLVEPKFIHVGGFVAHIEDVVVRKGYERKGIGRALMRTAIEHAKELGCYKCILACNESVAGFYEKLGFRRHEIEMRMDLK